jgi:hypothetical protein
VWVAGGIYLLLSLFLWSGVWLHHPTTTTTCGCGDPSLSIWFLAWPAYAVTHGLDPLHSTAIFHPAGVNLLANTSQLALGTLFAPVTWAFGPVATMNVVVTLSPILSALAMFVLLRRWVTWSPAAFAGGLLYGFSPFILVNLTNGHLMAGTAVIPPLFVACLDEALSRQRRRPMVVGVALGLLVALQFFIGTETLVIMTAGGLVGVLLVVGYVALRDRAVLRRRAPYGALAVVVGGATALVLLAYPAWYALAGPAHYSEPIWMSYQLGTQGAVPGDFLLPGAPVTTGFFGPGFNHLVGGYQGPVLVAQYLGIGLLAVLLGGVAVWRRDLRLWLFGVVALGSAALSIGVEARNWTPWRLFAARPVFDDIIPTRLLVVTYLAVAVMVGLIVDHAYVGLNNRDAAPLRAVAGRSRPGRAGLGAPRRAGALGAVLIVGLALAPVAWYLAQDVPFTTQAVTVPTWFTQVGPHLDGRQVLLVLPAPFVNESGMTWQAVDGMHFSMVGGGGPSDLLARAGPERAGQAAIDGVSPPIGYGRAVTTADIGAVGQALHGWGVTMVVIPDQPELPAYDRIRSVTRAAALITAATGERPAHQADAWVWTGVGRTAPVVGATGVRFSQCTTGVAPGGAAAVDHATRCMLGAGT